MNIQTDFTNEYETTKLQQHGGKINGFGGNNNFRASFTSIPNNNRPHPSSFRETHNFMPPDVYPPQLTSPMGSYDSHASFDFGHPPTGLGGPKVFMGDYNTNAGSLLSHHNNPKPNAPMAQQQSHAKYSNTHAFSGGVQLTSQTPYGPHIPTSAVGGNPTVPTAGPTAATNNSNTQSANNNQEEICTIFVVGFPEDMQEREFQNMFTFSEGFEAATLKIPNKEYTAYGARGYQGFSGPNDPYNLVTVNQGGVVVDGGRDGTMSSWPAAPGDESSSHFGGNNPNMAPRKQIIGFAKFKTRDAAIHARDTLQGRRVDIEKGAVLKAEMAKKNLHTKRGVGPVAGPALPPAAPSANQQMQNHPHMNGMNAGSHLPDQFNLPNDPYRQEPIDIAPPRPGVWRDQLQRDVHAVTNGINSSYSSDFHSRKEQEEDARRRERESTLYGAMGFPGAVGQGPPTRGPRERAEEEERRRKEKERIRANSVAFDGFLPSIAPPPLSRQNSGLNGMLPPPMESGSGLGASPLLANAFTAAPNINQQSAFSSQQQQEELAVGPWDHVHTSGVVSRSLSQRSTSPDDGQDSRFSPQGEGRRAQSESSTSSVGPGVIGSGSVSGDEGDIDLHKVMNELSLNTDNGTTSPQLPSPASGASSTSTRNAVDQNPPINTLYVGNLPTSPPPLGYPPDHLEESIRTLFSGQPGYKRMCFRTKANGPMCFVEFHDVASASRALNELYGNTLNGLVKHGGIRLSYSKNPLGVRTPTSATSPTSGSLQDQQQALSFQQDELVQTTPMGGSRNYGNTFMTSPPPRFTSPPLGHIGQPSMTNAGNHYPGRANGGSLSSLYSYNLASASSIGGPATSFSPFGISSPHTIPEQSSSDDHPPLHSQHFHRTLSPPVGNIEATRAG